MLDNIKTHFLVLTLSCLWFWLGFLKYTSALPVGSMYSYRKAGGSVAFSWMSKWGCVWRWDVGDIIDCFWLLLIIPLYFTLKTIYLVLFGDIIFTTQKMTTLHTKHTTLHTNYTLQTRYMSQISQLSKLAISVAVCVTVFLTQPYRSSATKLAAWTLSWQKPVFTVSSYTRHKANMTAMFVKKCGGHYLPTRVRRDIPTALQSETPPLWNTAVPTFPSKHCCSKIKHRCSEIDFQVYIPTSNTAVHSPATLIQLIAFYC